MPQIYTENWIEINEAIEPLHPANRAAAVYNTDWLSMSNHQRAIFLLITGAMNQGATVDFAVQQATDATGTGVKALTPAKAITQLTQAAGDGNDLVGVEVRSEELDVNGGFNYIRGVLTIDTAAVYSAVLPLRHVPNYPPVPVDEWTEIVP